MPRMADFALWATAAEPGLGFEPGAFMEAYGGNRAEAVHETLEADPVGAAILALTEREEFWEGTCKQLLLRLEQDFDEKVRQSREWPKSPRALSSRLRRLVTFLRESHILVTFHPRGTKGQRIVTITRGSGDSTVTTATTVTPPAGCTPDQSVRPEVPGDGPDSRVAVDAPVDDQPPPALCGVNSLEVRHNEGEVAVVTVVTVDSHIHRDEPHLTGNRRLAYDAA